VVCRTANDGRVPMVMRGWRGLGERTVFAMGVLDRLWSGL
jgi:hypothetical protein